MMSSSEVSVEVRKFPDSAEKRNLKRNRRYMVPLSFWGEIWWCHNEIMHYAAWNIAQKKRFSKDKIFFQDYKKLWLLINGYIKICDVPPLEKNSYISYHDINHRNKPEKNICCIWVPCRIWGRIYTSRASFRTRFEKFSC